MTLYVGEVVTIKAVAKDPVRGTFISTATAVVTVYAPPKNPALNTGDRTPDGSSITLTYDATLNAYIGVIPTAGFAAGIWYYKVTLSGTYTSWEYGTFTLVA